MQKPFQWLAWSSTFIVLLAAGLASFFPSLYLHHYFFIAGNSGWAIVGFLWREKSLIWFNLGLNTIYLIGIMCKNLI